MVLPPPKTVRRELGERWASSWAKLRGFSLKSLRKEGLENRESPRQEAPVCWMFATVCGYLSTVRCRAQLHSVPFSFPISARGMKPAKLIFSADCTFKVDLEGYVWGFVGLVLYVEGFVNDRES